jgi:pimeloyl-ACP methyl ester carboxylesterase
VTNPTSTTTHGDTTRGDGFLHRMLDAGEVHLHVAEARPAGELADAPLVVLCHGFPDYWWTWRRQMRALSAAGFWAVAPDMRGYNESDKPRGVEHYEIERLAGDIAGLIGALGRRDAIVVGHDWGGAAAWHFAMLHPHMTRRVAILDAPHPVVMTRHLRRPAQMKKSWYMFMFQLPRLPERIASRNDFEFMRRTFGANRFSAEDIEHHVDALRVPGVLTAAMGYYRAAMRRMVSGRKPEIRRIDAPVLVVWGDEDQYLGRELAEPPASLVPNARVVHVRGATHWVHADAADTVNELLVGFCREDRDES